MTQEIVFWLIVAAVLIGGYFVLFRDRKHSGSGGSSQPSDPKIRDEV